MRRSIFWVLLLALVGFAAFWHYEAQQSFDRFVQTNRSFEIVVEQGTLTELTDLIQVQFELLLKNSGNQEIPLDGISCLLYVGDEFLAPCDITDKIAQSVSAHGEWRLAVATEVEGYYYQNYLKAKAAGVSSIQVRGSVQIKLPIGREQMNTTRKFTTLIKLAKLAP